MSAVALVRAHEPDATAIAGIVSLAGGLHRAGLAAHALEDVIGDAATGAGLDASVLATPTSVLLSFRVDEGPPWTEMLRLAPGELDLGRVGRLLRAAEDVASGHVDGISARVAAIESSPGLYGRAARIGAFALASASAAPFFGGGPVDVAVSAGIALSRVVLVDAAPRLHRVADPLAAFVVTALSIAAAHAFGAHVEPCVLAGLIWQFPGLSMTIAATEVASGHWVSGGARAAGAVSSLVELGFGVALATGLGAVLPSAATSVATALPWWGEVAALAGGTAAIAVLMKAPRSDFAGIALASAVGYLTARVGAAVLGSELAAFPAALAVSLLATGVARWTRRPAFAVESAGLVALVPGSVGFRGVTALLHQDVAGGVGLAFTVAMVAMSIVAGTKVAKTLTTP